jgi:glyoxylase-like metal-dependent hydrolase (beta-lactamase superfamily II)
VDNSASPVICVTCGAHYPPDAVPQVCRICDDDRQWVPPAGQAWTEAAQLRAAGSQLVTEELEPGLVQVTVAPRVGIGQRGYLLSTLSGNVLWDPPAHLPEGAGEQIAAHGPVVAVAFSHPHFYGAMADWAAALGAPALVASDDAEWVTLPDPHVDTWSDARELLPEVRLVQCGGHFPGSAVLHWRDGAAGAGVLLTGDTILTVAAAGWVTFMYSYPNMIPLPARAVRAIADRVRPLPFERLYSGFGRIEADASACVERSAARYLDRLAS